MLEREDVDFRLETAHEKISLKQALRVAREFSAEGVKSAVTDIQQRRIEYAESVRRIMDEETVD